jgi:hypothetical protein
MPRFVFRLLPAVVLLAPLGCGGGSAEQAGPKDPEEQKQQVQDYKKQRQQEWKSTNDK